jgi:hypothetical protein
LEKSDWFNKEFCKLFFDKNPHKLHKPFVNSLAKNWQVIHFKYEVLNAKTK